MADVPAYTVTSYDCKEHRADIDSLAKQVATQQETLRSPYDPLDFKYLTRFQEARFIQPFDYRVMPWTSGCTRDDAKISVRHYVAQMADGDKEIVGWMLTERKKRFNQTYIYLSEISTIQVRSSSYRGVADALLGKLKEDAEADPDVAFIVLYPLRTELEPVYKKRGYLNYSELTKRVHTAESKQYPTVRHMFILTKPIGAKGIPDIIPDALMDTLKADADITREPVAKATAIANDGVAKKVEGADELAAFFRSGLARTLKTLPPLMEELRNALDNIQLFEEAGEPMEPKQKIDSLLEVVRLVPTNLQMPTGVQGGRRTRRRGRKTRTHRHRRHRKTHRRHK